jgi:hypothetical protein
MEHIKKNSICLGLTNCVLFFWGLQIGTGFNCQTAWVNESVGAFSLSYNLFDNDEPQLYFCSYLQGFWIYRSYYRYKPTSTNRNLNFSNRTTCTCATTFADKQAL